MNWMTKYLYVYKTRLIRSFTYKFDVYGNIIMQSIIMLTTAFFWKALFGDGSVGTINAQSMLTYTVVSSAMSVLFTTGVERRIQSSVEKGSIVTEMMHPVNVFGVYLAEDLGTVSALFFQNLLPIVIIGSVLVKVPGIYSLSYLPIFIISLIGSMMVNWLLAVIFGMWAFTAIEMDALFQVKKHVIRLLSGSIIPLWFFPEWFKNILMALPFAYIYQLPLNIYVGGASVEEIYRGMLVQLVWIVILLGVFLYLSKRVLKKVLVQGG